MGLVQVGVRGALSSSGFPPAVKASAAHTQVPSESVAVLVKVKRSKSLALDKVSACDTKPGQRNLTSRLGQASFGVPASATPQKTSNRNIFKEKKKGKKKKKKKKKKNLTQKKKKQIHKIPARLRSVLP
jgi:hypothetical protein